MTRVISRFRVIVSTEINDPNGRTDDGNYTRSEKSLLLLNRVRQPGITTRALLAAASCSRWEKDRAEPYTRTCDVFRVLLVSVHSGNGRENDDVRSTIFSEKIAVKKGERSEGRETS